MTQVKSFFKCNLWSSMPNVLEIAQNMWFVGKLFFSTSRQNGIGENDHFSDHKTIESCTKKQQFLGTVELGDKQLFGPRKIVH